MKKLASFVAAAFAVALAVAGGALAKSHHSNSFTVHGTQKPQAWVELLREFPRDPKPLQVEGTHRPAAHKPAPAKPKPKPKPAKPKPQPAKRAKAAKPKAQHAQPTTRRQGTTLSIYEQTTKPWFLTAQGCSAAQRRDSGVVVLDFGQPAFKHHGYGTNLFSGRFGSNHRITTAMVAWARGYVHCLPQNSTAFVTLARGTSNYHPSVPSTGAAGRRWALATIKFAEILQQKGLSDHVASAAADDAEPAWDPPFRKTFRFVRAFRAYAQGHTLYDYGSLDGGVGSVWSAKEAFYVAGGIRGTVALPEIYNRAMADEWAQLESIAKNRFHSHVRFAGVMTQGSASCRCSLRPHAARHALQRALAAVGVASTVVPQGGTNITG